MRNAWLIGCIGIGTTCWVFSGRVNAATIQTLDAGSAVTVVDRSATFDVLNYTHNGTALSDYREASLRISTEGDSWSGGGPAVQPYFNPFHPMPSDPATQGLYFPLGGNTTWVIIETTDSRKIYAAEFLYGNGWTTGDIYGVPWGNENGFIEWQTLNGGTLVSAGQIGPNPILHLATVVGFYDPAGFDQLWLRCRIATSIDPNQQALVLDNLNVQLTNVPPAPVIYGSDFAINPSNGVPSLTVYDTIPGCEYRMVYAESLTEPLTNPVTPPMPEGWQPGGGTLTFTDSNAAGKPHRFYRVQAR